jgi:hypothetical protein
MSLDERIIGETNTQFIEGAINASSNPFKYDIFQYPSDLGSDELKHFILFNINVRGKSTVGTGADRNLGIRLGNERTLTPVGREGTTAQLTETELQTAAGLGAVAVGAGAGVLAAKYLKSLSTRAGSTGSNIAKPITNAVITGGGAVAGAVSAIAALRVNDFLKPDTSFRLSDAIALYVDGPPTVRYNAQYSNKDLGTLAGLAAGGVSGVASAADPRSEQFAALATQFAKIPQIAGVNVADVIGATAKVALNPFKEVLFESIDFRSFGFRYRFFPKNRNEMDQVEQIIKRFKFHMHPELSQNKLFFIYPSEFQITYYFGSERNPFFHKFKPCVLESVEITYGGEQFSSFYDGKPTEVNMNLTFRETEILTKQQIMEGF